MPAPDLNLLVTLDVLLAEGSVARAAKRLGLSPSAMSRSLARLRQATGDPLLVRAGRGLVPTPRALALRARVGELVQEGNAVLRPAELLVLNGLVRTFALRSSEGFVENVGRVLIARIRREAPGVRLRFLQKADKESDALRDGRIDLDVGVIGDATRPELRAQGLYRDRHVGVVRKGHPLSRGRVTLARFAAGEHLVVSRRGLDRGPIDNALAAAGMERKVVIIVAGFTTALELVRGSDLIVIVPERHTGTLRSGLFTFALPVATPEITVSMLWHPRLDADPAHRWFRQCVREACTDRVVASSARRTGLDASTGSGRNPKPRERSKR